MNLSVERLFSGLFECGECGIRYRASDASEADLFCSECGADLEPVTNVGEVRESEDEE